jgi:hypothetical protein
MSTFVTLKYDPVWCPLDWAKKHCKSYITNDVHQDGYYTFDNGKIDYFFADERDAMLFKLAWSHMIA